jgi:predicted RNA-binding protein with PIN domain
MALHIIIDGYNLIRQSRQLSALELMDMQTARESLADMLAAYKKLKGYRITVVFDGTMASAGMPRQDRLKGIDLLYSSPGVLADSVIKRIASREKQGALVVSSDRDIVDYASREGAAVISSPEFEDRLSMAHYVLQKGVDEGEEPTGWQGSTRKKGPSRRLSKRQRQNRRKIAKI